MAAARRRDLHEASQGEVPIVKPCEEETTVWKVWRVGREMREDWCVIQRWRTESKLLAKTILWEDGQYQDIELTPDFIRIK